MSTARQRSSSASSHSTKRNSKATASPSVAPQTLVPLPAHNDREGWRAHWQAQGQLWRTEPEIDQQRQAELEQRRAIVPDIEQGVYPFRAMKLDRADIEWLLATHENGRGPVNWSDESQRQRQGLDLRGADLSQVNLSRLPLAATHGGLNRDEWRNHLPPEQRAMAAVHLEKAYLQETHLEGAYLRQACLEKAYLQGVHLEQATLYSAHLENAHFIEGHLEEADLRLAHLEEASLRNAHLERAYLRGAHLEQADLRGAHLEGTDLRGAVFDTVTKLEDVVLGNEKFGFPLLEGVHWQGVNLTAIKWPQVEMLGDEHTARQGTFHGKGKSSIVRRTEYEQSVRANRQLAVALQAQGLQEEAARFAYRAQVLQRCATWFQLLQPDMKLRQRRQALGVWLFSWFLFSIAGYGYKPSRSFLAYLLVISGFATAYYFLGHIVGPALSPLGAFVFSMTSFHGRGFFPGNNISLDNPLTVLAALEALVGLIIEVTFIATLTQRFFNR